MAALRQRKRWRDGLLKIDALDVVLGAVDIPEKSEAGDVPGPKAAIDALVAHIHASCVVR